MLGAGFEGLTQCSENTAWERKVTLARLGKLSLKRGKHWNVFLKGALPVREQNKYVSVMWNHTRNIEHMEI